LVQIEFVKKGKLNFVHVRIYTEFIGTGTELFSEVKVKVEELEIQGEN
jgi:hypothetical protein